MEFLKSISKETKKLVLFLSIILVLLVGAVLFAKRAHAAYVPYGVSSGALKQRMEWISVQNTGTVSIVAQSGFVNGIARAGVGLVTMSWPTTIWTSAPACTCTAVVGGRTCAFTGGAAPTISGVQVDTSAGSSDEDRAFYMICIGPR